MTASPKKPPTVAGQPLFVDSQSRLAAILGVSTTTLRDKLHRGAPAKTAQGYDVNAWREWYQSCVPPDKNAATPRLAKWREGKLREEYLTLKARRLREEGATLDCDEVDRMHLHLSSRLKSALFLKLENELPGKVVGRTAQEIRMVARQIGDEICELMRAGVESFDESHPNQAEKIDALAADAAANFTGKADAERIVAALRQKRLLALYFKSDETEIDLETKD